MVLLVNLSTIHNYSIQQTIEAFVKLTEDNNSIFMRNMHGLLRYWLNYFWVNTQLSINYKSLIEPYKLGRIDTEKFLDELLRIFSFLTTDTQESKQKLITAWNSSIQLPENEKYKFEVLLKHSSSEEVYLISNTNELNVQAILALLKKKFSDLEWEENPDISIQNFDEPVKILPNIYLCLSYRYQAFKEKTMSTMSLIQHLSATHKDCKLVSQHAADLDTAKKYNIQSLEHVEFFNSKEPSKLIEHEGRKGPGL